jgi:hypothetical protein
LSMSFVVGLNLGHNRSCCVLSSVYLWLLVDPGSSHVMAACSASTTRGELLSPFV